MRSSFISLESMAQYSDQRAILLRYCRRRRFSRPATRNASASSSTAAAAHGRQSLAAPVRTPGDVGRHRVPESGPRSGSGDGQASAGGDRRAARRPIVSVDMHELTAGMSPLVPEAQHETLILIAVTAALAAPMQPELPTLVVSAAFALDLTLDPPPAAPTVDPSLTVENQSGPPHGVGAGAVTPRAEFQFAQVSELAGHAPAPFAAQVGGTPSLGNGMAEFLAQSHSSQELISPPLADVSQVQAIGLAATTTHSSELAVFGLPKVEQDLLHTFGVTGQIPQVAALPVAFSFALHAAHHTYISDLSPVTASSATAAPERQSAAGQYCRCSRTQP